MLWAHNKQSDLYVYVCVVLYIIYSINSLYMYIAIFIYVLLSDKKVPHAMPQRVHSSV